MTQTRVPRGVHTAGQFSASAKNEARLVLAQNRLDVEDLDDETANRLSQDQEISPCAACTGSGSNATGDAGCSLCEGTGLMTRAEQEAYAEATSDDAQVPVNCGSCNGTGLREFDNLSCGLCDGTGTATQAQYDEYRTYLATLASYNDDSFDEPDFEAIAERRAESAYERRGAAAEWGGANL